jgi:hypothetical protein
VFDKLPQKVLQLTHKGKSPQTGRRQKMSVLTATPTVVQTKVHFNNRIAYMSDGTCRFENYPHSFDGAISALKWGRAYEAALDAEAKAKIDLEDLMREVGVYK